MQHRAGAAASVEAPPSRRTCQVVVPRALEREARELCEEAASDLCVHAPSLPVQHLEKRRLRTGHRRMEVASRQGLVEVWHVPSQYRVPKYPYQPHVVQASVAFVSLRSFTTISLTHAPNQGPLTGFLGLYSSFKTSAIIFEASAAVDEWRGVRAEAP